MHSNVARILRAPVLKLRPSTLSKRDLQRLLQELRQVDIIWCVPMEVNVVRLPLADRLETSARLRRRHGRARR